VVIAAAVISAARWRIRRLRQAENLCGRSQRVVLQRHESEKLLVHPRKPVDGVQQVWIDIEIGSPECLYLGRIRVRFLSRKPGQERPMTPEPSPLVESQVPGSHEQPRQNGTIHDADIVTTSP
jgi:hypothetical protein